MKRILDCIGFICLMFFLLFAFISDAFPAQVIVNPIKSFSLTINSKKVIVKLPDAIPSMETAKFAYEECFNLTICRKRWCLNNKEPGHDHVDFIYTNKAEVIALVWIKTLEQTFVAWKYVDGVPVLVDIDAINELIKDAEKIKESSFNLWPTGGGKSRKYLLVDDFLDAFKKGYEGITDFTWEGELSPNEFTEWKVIKTQLDLPRGITWIYWQNPDPDSPIKVVVGEVYIDETLVMYRYFKYGVPYMFSLDNEKNKYVQYKFTEKEKKSCMKCHKDKVELPSRELKEIFS